MDLVGSQALMDWLAGLVDSLAWKDWVMGLAGSLAWADPEMGLLDSPSLVPEAWLLLAEGTSQRAVG